MTAEIWSTTQKSSKLFFFCNVFNTQVCDLERTFSVLLKVPRVDVQMAWFVQGEMEVDTTLSVVEQESTKTREKSQKVEDWQIALRGSREGMTVEQAIKREERRVESQMTGRGRRGCASHRRSLRWERSAPWFCTAFALYHEFFAPCAARTKARVEGENESLLKKFSEDVSQLSQMTAPKKTSQDQILKEAQRSPYSYQYSEIQYFLESCADFHWSEMKQNDQKPKRKKRNESFQTAAMLPRIRILKYQP